MRETPNEYPPVSAIPCYPYYPQFPPSDHQYLLEEPQYILHDPQYILRYPQQSELNLANVSPYPYFSPYPPQYVYPPVAYTYGTEPQNVALGKAPLPFYGDWRQIPKNIDPVAKMEPIEIVEKMEPIEIVEKMEPIEIVEKMEPIEIVEIDEPMGVLEPTKNFNIVSTSESSGNATLTSGVKQGGSNGQPKIDILELAMNKTSVFDQNNIFMDEVFNPIHPVQNSDETSLEQLDDKKIVVPSNVSDIVNLPIEQLTDLVARYGLNEQQIELCRDIRRRGKNKVAAKNCRKRKMEHIEELQSQVETTRRRQENLKRERKQLEQERARWREKLLELEQNILKGLARNIDQFRLEVDSGTVQVTTQLTES